MQKAFFEKFRRITSSGFYLPQVDGLRFVAIFMVVCIAHIPNFINQKVFNGELLSAYWARFSLEGVFGVVFFFMISGFVLGFIFANKHIRNTQTPTLKHYYVRRLTRMEPPYLLALIIFFLALVLVIKKYEWNELFPHFVASFFYVHNEVYREHSYVLPVAWTLEIEIQFYILAPLLGLIYRLRKKELRWTIMIAYILVSAYYWYDVWEGMHVFKFLHYFICGMLIADLYVEKIRFPGPSQLGFILGLLCLALIPFVHGYYNVAGYIVKGMSMVILIYTAITNPKLAKLFSFAPIAIVGGMCYSIYLIHEQVISATGRMLVSINIENRVIFFVLLFTILLIAVLIASAAYYKFVEQPCMRKDWWKHLLSKRRSDHKQ